MTNYRIAEVTRKGEYTIVMAGLPTKEHAIEVVRRTVLNKEIESNVSSVQVEEMETGEVVSLLKRVNETVWKEYPTKIMKKGKEAV